MKDMVDSITLTSIAAQKAGMSYGQYVAKFGCVNPEEEEIIPPEGYQVCPECGKAFTGRKGRPVYCSSECRVKHGQRKYMEKYRERHGENLRGVERICVVCGKPIPVDRYAKAKTCSYECSDELTRRNKNKRQNKKSAERKAKAMEAEVC